MKKKPLVLLDMDGCLSNFMEGMQKFYPKKKILEMSYDQIGNLMGPFVEAHGFLHIKKMPSADLLEKLYLHFKEVVDFAICTSTGNGGKDLSVVRIDKANWLKVYFPDTLARIPLILVTKSKEKSFFANDHTLLIDDTDFACAAFRAAGGHTRLYVDGKTTWGDLKNEVEYLLI